MKRKLLITLLALVAALCCAFGLTACNGLGGLGGLGGNGEGKFTLSNVKKIKIKDYQSQTGDSQWTVEKYLGPADEKTDYQLVYYGSNYKSVIAEQEKLEEQMLNVSSEKELENLLEKMVKLEESLQTMKYAYLTVQFEGYSASSSTAISVVYDAAKCESQPDAAKQCKQAKLSESDTLLYSDISNVNFNVAVDYTDGSYKLIPLPDSAKTTVDNTVTGTQNMTWEDDWGMCTAKYSFVREYSYITNYGAIKFSFTIDEGDTAENHSFTVTVTGHGDFSNTNDVSAMLRKHDALTKTVIIGKGVESHSFHYFFAAETVTFKNDVTSIHDMILVYCESVKTINIPVSVTEIQSSAFAFCSELTDIYYNGTKTQWNAIDKHVDDKGFTGYEGDGSWNWQTSGFTVHCTDGDIDYQDNDI